MSVLRWLIFSQILALVLIPSSAQCQRCDPILLSQSASPDGYKAVPGTSYCEGFIDENHANEIQIVYFETKGLVTPTTRWLRIEPAISQDDSHSNVAIRGTSIVLGYPYRINAFIPKNKNIVIDLNRIVKKRNIPVDGLGFIAEADAPQVDELDNPLIPVSVRDEQASPTTGAPVIGVRLPSASTHVQYRFNGTGSPAPWKTYIPSPGSYGVSEFVVEKSPFKIVTFELIVTLANNTTAKLARVLRVTP